MTAPFTLAIDVGSPKSNRLGWAAGLERGGASSYTPVVDLLAARLFADGRATIGFEAPIWAPRRERLLQVTDARQGVERKLGRAWTAGPGASALATCLGLMTWTFARIAESSPVAATGRLDRWRARGGLLVWEAFVTGVAKLKTQDDDAGTALDVFHWRDGPTFGRTFRRSPPSTSRSRRRCRRDSPLSRTNSGRPPS